MRKDLGMNDTVSDINNLMIYLPDWSDMIQFKKTI